MKIAKNEVTEKAVRHGEVLLVPVAEIPKGFERAFEGDKYIVAMSETHHHHVAVGSAKDALTVYKPKGADTADIYLRVNSPSKLEHLKTFDRHETKELKEGLYLVRPKTEYDPWTKLLNRVRD